MIITVLLMVIMITMVLMGLPLGVVFALSFQVL